MVNLHGKKMINWPGDYPLAKAAIKNADKRREARRKRGHFQRYPLVMRYARSYARGDKPGRPTGPEIIHGFDNRQERRRKAAEHRQWMKRQNRRRRG